MMVKKYILTSLLAAATAAAFSIGSAADVYADDDRLGRNDDVREEHNSRDRLRTDFFRVEREDNDDRQVVQVVPSNGNKVNNSNYVGVPEPASMLLIGSALGGLALLRSRKSMD